MKKFLLLILSAVILLSVFTACEKNTGDKDGQTSEPYQLTDEDEIYYNSIFNCRFYEYSEKLTDFVGREALEEWCSKPPYLNKGVYGLIKEFGISRDDFVGCAVYKNENEDVRDYTDEEIDALYSDDLDRIYRAFPNPNTIVIGDTVFTPRKLNDMTYESMKEYGIDDKHIADKMAQWEYYLSDSTFYGKMKRICDKRGIEYKENGYFDANKEPVDFSQLSDNIYFEYAGYPPVTETVYDINYMTAADT